MAWRTGWTKQEWKKKLSWLKDDRKIPEMEIRRLAKELAQIDKSIAKAKAAIKKPSK